MYQGDVFLDIISPDEYDPLSLMHRDSPTSLKVRTPRLQDPLLVQERKRIDEDKVDLIRILRINYQLFMKRQSRILLWFLYFLISLSHIFHSIWISSYSNKTKEQWFIVLGNDTFLCDTPNTTSKLNWYKLCTIQQCFTGQPFEVITIDHMNALISAIYSRLQNSEAVVADATLNNNKFTKQCF